MNALQAQISSNSAEISRLSAAVELLTEVKGHVEVLRDDVAKVRNATTELSGKVTRIDIDMRRVVWLVGAILTMAIAAAARVWVP